MWGVLQETARAITLVLDGSGGSSRKCPRCKGSGLLKNSFSRLEKNGAHPNEPCWFCEGIGALPIVGLTGFVLARTTPCLQALHNKLKKPCVELLEQSHDRYGKETYKFTDIKLVPNLVDLCFDHTRSPWLHYTNPDSQQSVRVKSKAKDGLCLSHVSESTQQPLLSSANKDLPINTGLFQRLLSTSLFLSISNSLSNATPSLSPSLLSSLQPRPALAMAVAGHQNLANTHPEHELRSGFTTPLVPHPQKTSFYSTTSIGDEHQEESAVSHQCATKLQSQSASSLFINTKRQRRQRKARNCIRSKARKEAEERAGRLMRTLKHKDAQDSSPPYAYVSPDDATSQIFHVLDAHRGQFSPPSRALRLAYLTSAAVCLRSWINRLVPDEFKASIPIQCQSIPS